MNVLLLIRPQLRQHVEIFQRRRIAAHLLDPRGDISQQPPHDLPAPRLRQRIREPDHVRLRDCADFFLHVLAQ